MFREMRRKKQLMSTELTEEVLSRCTNGVLACLGDEGYPYAVPVSYAYYNNKIYFHSGKAGHKVDSLENYEKVSFAVVDEDKIISSEYTSYFRSVIAFGRARFVEGDEWHQGFKALVEKYSFDQPEDKKHKEITGCTQSHIIAIDIDHLTGKEAIEFVRMRQEGKL